MGRAAEILDRAIEAVAPAWAAKRAVAREALATHRGGIQTRTSRPWGRSSSFRGGREGDRRNQFSRRDRARRVYAEHPIGRSLLKTETDNVVSSGFTLQAKTPSEDFNGEVEDKFAEWLEIADIRGLLSGVDLVRQFYRSPRRDGDGGIVLVDKGGESRLQYIPGDLISNPNGVYGPGMIDGIEVDAATRPIAYNVKNQDEWGALSWDRVPAGNFIYLAPEVDDDLGVRGDTCYSTIFSYLDQIDGYVDAVIIAARMAAVFGLVISDEAGPKQAMGLGSIQNSQGNNQHVVTLENGMVRYTGASGKVSQVVAQQPMQNTPDFIRAICRILGLPFDMPLELVLKDLSQVNFSSARVGLLQYYRACRARQKAFSRRCLTRIYRWWLSREINRGRIVSALPDPSGGATNLVHKFLAEGWDYTDPVSEIQADWMQVALGTKTKKMVAAERGRDFDEMLAERQATRAAERLAELPDVELNTTRDRVEIEGEKPPTEADKKAEADAASAEFLRKAWLGFQADGTVADVAANLTDLRALTKAVGLPVDASYVEPFLPVQDGSGRAVTGDVVKDPQGDVVGGAVDPLPSNGTSSTMTGSAPPLQAEAGKLDPVAAGELLNSVGVAVRAGVMTPTPDDENDIRVKLGLPPMSEEAKAAWTEDGGTRRPITLTMSTGDHPAATPANAAEVPAGEAEPKDGTTKARRTRSDTKKT